MPVVVIHGAVDTDARDVPIVGSEYTRALLVTDDNHYHVHEGKAFYVIYSGLANTSDVIEVLLQTPDTDESVNLSVHFVSALACTVEIWDETTKTYVLANDIPAENRKEDSTNVTGVKVCHTPAGAESNPATHTIYVGATTVGGRADDGGTTNNEHIAGRNKTKLYRMTSRADGNSMTFYMDWYDHTEYA